MTLATACGDDSPPSEEAIRMVILIQGIDSRSSCDDNASDPNSFLTRRQTVLDKLTPLGVKVGDVVGFSYSGVYVKCSPTGKHGYARVTEAGSIPAYLPADTCAGVTTAARRLEGMLRELANQRAKVRFELVGHSMGGLVASTLVATAERDFVQSHVTSVVLLDSPVAGIRAHNPVSACRDDKASWQDLAEGSKVVDEIAGAACKNRSVRFYAVIATEIGSSLDCAISVRRIAPAAIAASVPGEACNQLPQAFVQSCLTNRSTLATALQQAQAHSRVWLEPGALSLIAEAYSSR
jgi:pimeloyl-ACP methyl ester carboxylesterase